MVYEPSEWDLSDLHSGNVEDTFKNIQSRVESLESKKDQLSDNISSDDFMKIVKEFEQLKSVTCKIACFTELKFTEDSSNPESAALRSKVENFLTKMQNKLIFFSLWFKELSDDKANELIKASDKYHYHFERLRKTKPYTLKENEEKIINIKDITGASALNNVYDTLTTQFEYDLDGKKVTQNELTKLVRDPSPEKRKAAYMALLTKYMNYKDVIGEIYKNIVNDWREESIGLRGYKSPINVRNVGNDIPDEAIDALLKVCEKNQSLFHRFFELKRKKIGLDKLRRFDIYAPIKETKDELDYDDAVKLVLETFEKFSPKFKEAALEVIEKNHVHAKIQKNKYTGAFCYGLGLHLHPYVLVNYTGTSRDVSTLAHELGHAVHDILSMNLTEFTWHACLPLAETASVFGEMLLSEKMAEKYPEKAEEMLFAKLDDIYATIIRQSSFVIFEKKAHKMFEEGKTIEDVSKVYIEDLRKQLGPNIEVDDIFANEWIYIPHIFHTPFYCYAYAFGNLLVLALWEMYKEEGESFVPKMLDFLSKGGSEAPVDITKAIGVDITSEEFWQKGFHAIEQMIDKLEGS